MRFERRFVVRASVERVRAFHERPDALRRLMPAPVTGAMPRVEEGARFRFRVWIPFPVAWEGCYQDVREDGFVDVQVRGPFRAWRHEHRWHALPDGSTEVADAIEAEPRTLAARLILLGLRPAFAYRAWRTRAATKAK